MGHHRAGTGRSFAPVVLALRALGLGDALTGVPALRGLRRAYPEHTVLLACPPAVGRWLTALNVVDGVVPAHGLDPLTDAPRPDVAVNLHGRGPRSHHVLGMTRPRRMVGFACAAADFTDGPSWDDGAHEVERWCTLARWAGGTCDPADLRLGSPGRAALGPVVLHPGAASASRRWPATRWRAVARALQTDHRVVVTGGPAERALCEAVCRGTAAESRAGRTPLPALADLIAGSSLLISGDTGTAHLATAFGIPSVTLFGPVSPDLWGPAIDRDLHRCLWHGRGATVPGDPHGDHLDPRLAAITVAEVLTAAHELVASQPGAADSSDEPRGRATTSAAP